MAIITTAAFRRSDNRHMVRTGRVLTDISEQYSKELIRVGLARECSASMAAPENKSANFPVTGGIQLYVSHPAPVLMPMIEIESENGEVEVKRRGRPKKEVSSL